MTDKAGGTPPFCLNPFPYNCYIIRINVGQVPQRHIRITLPGKPRVFAGQPFQRAVSSHVDDRIRFPDIPQPFIISQIMMRRRTGRIVDDLAQIFAKPSGRLHTDINIAVGNAGNQQGIVMIKHGARCFTPGSRHLFLYKGILFTKPLLILFSRDTSRCFFYLFFRKKTPVVGKACCYPVN